MEKLENMNVLVLGSGGREHSLCYNLIKSKKISNLCKLDHYQIKVKPILNPGKYKQQGLLKCPINEVEKLFKKIKIKKI